jgi:hypothetical protein
MASVGQQQGVGVTGHARVAVGVNQDGPTQDATATAVPAPRHAVGCVRVRQRKRLTCWTPWGVRAQKAVVAVVPAAAV